MKSNTDICQTTHKIYMNPQEIFATAIWSNIPSDDDVSWVARVATQNIVKQPMGDYGAIIQDMLDRGVSAESIARFAKIVGFETASGICYALEDPSGSIDNPDSDRSINWGLFRTDPDTDEIIEPLLGSHEILLSLDPTGNEMEPTEEAFLALNKSHHDTVVSGNARLRRQWLCEYLDTTDVEVFEFQSHVLPFEVIPNWPGRRIGFFLGFTETDIWIMSNGLSNPEHPSDNANWHKVVPLPAPEILSRVPIGSITRRTKITELVKNEHIQKFIYITCASLSLHIDKKSRRVAHKAAHITGVNISADNDALIHFSNAESLGLAEPIPLSDHDFLRVPVSFATTVDNSELKAIDADAFEYSKMLQRDGLIGFITTTGRTGI